MRTFSKVLIAVVLVIIFSGGLLFLHEKGFFPFSKGCNRDMVFVQGGTFMMGATPDQIDIADDDEYPSHQVTLSDFYISKYLVTVGQFAEFVDATGYLTDAERGVFSDSVLVYGSWSSENGSIRFLSTTTWRNAFNGKGLSQKNMPVVHISWNDANAYCEWLSQTQGKPYRLPTEAEWEYAARGGIYSHSTLYSGSNKVNDVAWYIDNSLDTLSTIGEKQANELGLFDMSGLVFEWCWDAYVYYTDTPQVNPKYDSDIYRVARGGSISRFPSECSVTQRGRYQYYTRGGGLGFRVAYSNP